MTRRLIATVLIYGASSTLVAEQPAFSYASGPDKGRVATAIRVEKAGPVATKIKNRP
jgi:hypothetical protein